MICAVASAAVGYVDLVPSPVWGGLTFINAASDLPVVGVPEGGGEDLGHLRSRPRMVTLLLVKSGVRQRVRGRAAVERGGQVGQRLLQRQVTRRDVAAVTVQPPTPVRK